MITSKIARFDFPLDWPDLLERIIEPLKSSFGFADHPQNDIIQINSLYTLHLAMKSIASKPIPSARSQLRQYAPSVFGFALQAFQQQISIFFEKATPSTFDSLETCLNIARICLKCMRRLIVTGFESFLTAPGPLVLDYNSEVVWILVQPASEAYAGAIDIPTIDERGIPAAFSNRIADWKNVPTGANACAF